MTIEDEEDMAPVPAAMEMEAALPATVAEPAGEEEPEAREGTEEDERVGKTGEVAAEGKEEMREGPNSQWLLLYGPTAPWVREASDEEAVAGLEPWQPIVVRVNPSWTP